LAACRPRIALKLALALSLGLAAAACSSTAIDGIPGWAGGEPAGAPPRLATELQYPPVNDRPPPRETHIVSEEEQARIERELAAARDTQARQAAQVRKERANMIANQPRPAAPQESQP
jgi:hypothetical protein